MAEEKILTLLDIFVDPNSLFVGDEVSKYKDNIGKEWEKVDISRYFRHVRADQLFSNLSKLADSLGLNPRQYGSVYYDGARARESRDLAFLWPISDPKSYCIKIENGKISLHRER